MKEYYEELVKFWLDKLISESENYELVSKNIERGISIEIFVSKDNIGKIIGKNGKIITSLRNLISSIANKDKKDVFIKVIEKK